MSSKDFDPLRLDVVAFAKGAEQKSGNWPLVDLKRLAETAVDAASASRESEVRWAARGEAREARGGEPQIWLHVEAGACIALECQRCLQPVDVPLAVSQSFMFVHGEEAAAALDAETEDDVLAIARALDLRTLIEDELILAEPIVPRHEVCPDPLPVPADLASLPEEEDSPHPFAALAALKRSQPN